MNSATNTHGAVNAAAAGTFKLAGEFPINRMGYGAMQLPGPGVWGSPADRAEAVKVVRRAVELGVNHIDTSDFYGPHVANEIIREALHPYPDDLVIVTKVGAHRTPDKAWPAALSGPELRQAVHENLRRLDVDHLDVVNLRIVEEGGGLSPSDSIAEPLSVLAGLRDQGLISHLGVSNVSPAQFAEARQITPLACVQNEYNLIRRRDDAMVDECAAAGIAFVPFFPLGTYTLTHDRKPGEDAKVPMVTPLRSDPLEAVARRLDATVFQVALAWLLARSPAMVCIPGTASAEHLEQNIASAGLRLSEADLEELDGARDPSVDLPD